MGGGADIAVDVEELLLEFRTGAGETTGVSVWIVCGGSTILEAFRASTSRGKARRRRILSRDLIAPSVCGASDSSPSILRNNVT